MCHSIIWHYNNDKFEKDTSDCIIFIERKHLKTFASNHGKREEGKREEVFGWGKSNSMNSNTWMD